VGSNCVTVNREAVRRFSHSNGVGMRNFMWPFGIRSLFMKFFLNLICLNIAFWMRNDNIQYLSLILIAGNWSSIVPFLGWNHEQYISFRSRNGIISLQHGCLAWSHSFPA
jgi:hypothetical protein